MKYLISSIFFLFSINLIFSLNAEIVYIEGTVDIRPGSSSLREAQIGDVLQLGDTIITGMDGYCELILQPGSSIEIDGDTVFAYQRGSTSVDKEPENIFHIALGRVLYKFGIISSDEPAITTPSSTCGIRGTEFSVVAGADGQSLYVVTQGEVAVESQGQSVSLTQQEGVEVFRDGLGAKFAVLQGNIDYSLWRDQAANRALEDPAGGMASVITLLEENLKWAEYFWNLWNDNTAAMQVLAQDISALRDQGNSDGAQELVDQQFLPLKQQTIAAALNYRYYALSILSLRRYMVTDFYISVRTSHWLQGFPQDFLDRYNEFTNLYENRVVPFLVEADI